MRFLLALVALLTLAACGDQRSEQFANVEAECRRLYASPQLDPLRGRLIFPAAATASMQMLTSDERASEQDRRALLALADIARQCRGMADAFPGSAFWLTNLRNSQDVIRAKLFNREITFGQANRELVAAADVSRRDEAMTRPRYCESFGRPYHQIVRCD